jgi:hypothetical protein
MDLQPPDDPKTTNLLSDIAEMYFSWCSETLSKAEILSLYRNHTLDDRFRTYLQTLPQSQFALYFFLLFSQEYTKTDKSEDAPAPLVEQDYAQKKPQTYAAALTSSHPLPVVKDDEKSKAIKTPKEKLSSLQSLRHANPVVEIRSLAARLRNGKQAIALHQTGCQVCTLFLKKGNSKGQVPKQLYKILSSAHGKLSKHDLAKVTKYKPTSSQLPSSSTAVKRSKDEVERYNSYKGAFISRIDDAIKTVQIELRDLNPAGGAVHAQHHAARTTHLVNLKLLRRRVKRGIVKYDPSFSKLNIGTIANSFASGKHQAEQETPNKRQRIE